MANFRLLRRLPELAQRFVRQLPPESAAPPTVPVAEDVSLPVVGVVERGSRWPWVLLGALLGAGGVFVGMAL